MEIPGKIRWLAFLLCLPFCLAGASPGPPDSWIPARWQGGPLELERRAMAKTLPADPAIREAIAAWYDAATLGLLEGSPVNCLLVTWSAPADGALERRQHQLVKLYAADARRRGVAVLGVVYPGADPASFVPPAVDAHLDGLVLDGEFASGFAERVAQALAVVRSAAVVIPVFKDAASARAFKGPVPAVEGVSPSARSLADMGIRGAPSSQPWIQSNVWLVRSFRRAPAWRPVWIGYQPESGSSLDYARFVADAAVAGGRWIAALDDTLRAQLLRRDATALGAWQRMGACLRFAEDHAEWRGFLPYGNLAIVQDAAAAGQEMSEEYLKLVARRQVPYRLIARAQLDARSLAGVRAVLATDLAPPSDAERTTLRAFAALGGVVVAGPSWGAPPQDQPYAEVPLGKGRVIVYKDPDAESVARDMRNLLSDEEVGVVAFNVPSVITYASAGDSGKRVLVQLLNYSNSPAEAMTIRVAGNFKSARLFTPEAAPSSLAIRHDAGQTDVTIPKLALWGGVLLE